MEDKAPGLAAGLNAAYTPVEGSKPGDTYLGDVNVVEGLVREFAGAVLQAESEEDVYAAIDKIALIFAGGDPAYVLMPDYHSRLGVGLKACERLAIDPDQSYLDIMRSAFADYASQLFDVVKEHGANVASSIEWQWKIDQVIEHASSLMLGTIDTLYPPEESA